jgi:cell wall-associated NlpC family hydrolase
MAMRGKPYRYGGDTPSGFDCSGLVVYSYGQFDIKLPRNSYKQYKKSKPIYERDLQPGDLVFFRTTSSFVSHVGIYVGDNRFVHAPGKGKTVRADSLNNDYYRRRFVGAGTFF